MEMISDNIHRTGISRIFSIFCFLKNTKHTHTHHMYTHAHTHTHARARACACMHACTQAHICKTFTVRREESFTVLVAFNFEFICRSDWIKLIQFCNIDRCDSIMPCYTAVTTTPQKLYIVMYSDLSPLWPCHCQSINHGLSIVSLNDCMHSLYCIMVSNTWSHCKFWHISQIS